PATLRGASHGWGEIGLLAEDVHHATARERELERRVADLDALRQRLRALRAALDHEGPPREALASVAGGGPLGALAEQLDQRLAGDAHVRDEQRAAVRAAAEAFDAALDQAQQ